MPSAHATLMGGSNAYRRIMCPGSLKAEKAIPGQPAGYAAAEGTACHSVMERLAENEDLAPDDFINDEVNVDGYEITIDEDIVYDKIEPAWRALKEIVEEMPPTATGLIVEPQVGFAEGAWGSTDLVWRSPGSVLNVLDWKFGRVYVDEIESYQLMFYAAATLFGPTTNLKIKKLRSGVKKVRMHIVQPLHDPVWRYEEVPAQKLKDFTDLVYDRLPLLETEGAQRRAGTWCGYCRAKISCEEYIGGIRDVVVNDDWRSQSGVQLYALRKLAAKAKKWAEEVIAFEKQALENGVLIPGRKLVEGRQARAWGEDESKIEAALAQYDLAPDDLYKAPSLMSPPQVEKLLKARFRREERAEALATLESLVVRQATTTTVVDDSDPRPAVNLGQKAGEAFAANIDSMIE